MTPNMRNYLLAGTAILVAGSLGYGAARLSEPTPVEQPEAEEKSGPADTIMIDQASISASQIIVAPAQSGEVDAVIMASAAVQATPDAEAVLTARAPGTVTRILKRIGDFVRAGETVAILESRDASAITADRNSAAARVTLARRQLEREQTLLAQGVSPRADYEAAQANLAVAQAEAQRAQSDARAVRVTGDGRHVSVISPVSGRLSAVDASLGEFVSAETALFRVIDPSRLEIAASVPLADATRVRAGDRVELRVGGDRVIEGRVRSTTGVVDPQTRGATVVISPAASAGSLAPGQLVQARIFASGEASANGIMVPLDAVQSLGSRNVVFVRTATGFRAQTVQIGARNGDIVAITSGLAPNTAIATTNAFLLKAELQKDEAE